MDFLAFFQLFFDIFFHWRHPPDSSVMMALVNYHTLYHNHQFTPFDGFRPGSGQPVGNMKSAAFQNFHIQHETSRFHVQEFDAVTTGIDEDIYTAVKRILAHTGPDQTAQGMETLAHVRRLRPEPVLLAVIQTKHCPELCAASPD